MSLKSDLNPPVIVTFYYIVGMLISFILTLTIQPGGNQFTFMMGGFAFISVTSTVASILVWFLYKKSARQYWYILMFVIVFSLSFTICLIRGLFE